MYSAMTLLAGAALIPLASAAVYDVAVGPDGQFVYRPEFVSAAVGDTVRFTFQPKNHTVTQSAFDNPCVAIPDGLRSGFRPVTTGSAPEVFEVNVRDTAPLWFYCGQGNHCRSGMVFGINPPAEGNERSFSAFKRLATGEGASSSSSGASYTTPPVPSGQTATATVTRGESTYLTTYTSYPGTPEPTFASSPVNHEIVVGPGGTLAYSPANITASIGDTVTFSFRQKNHTVTQSSFSAPCQPLLATTGQQGFASGFRPVGAEVTSDFPTFQITVNDTAPIWGYCGQSTHCGSGMVFSINAVETGPNNFAAFQGLARRINGTQAGGTGTTRSDAPGPTSTAGNGNAAMKMGVSSAFLVLVAAVLVSM